MDKKSGGMRSGYTTGSCAAAAAKAAVMALAWGSKTEYVSIKLPGGDEAVLRVEKISCRANEASAAVIKDAGDDADVTDGLEVRVRAVLGSSGVEICGGQGVGKVTKPGLQVPVGESAVNPVPRSMITGEVREVLPGGGAFLDIEVPEAEDVVHKTLNSRLGIEGGISILGTTGIVRPMSDEAYIDSLTPQVDQAAALGYKNLVLVPGQMGAQKAQNLGFPEEAVVQTSNYIGSLLNYCVKKEIEGVILLGHIGKLLKVAAGIFMTDSRVADARRETLAAHAAMLGADNGLIRRIMELNTADESAELLKKAGLRKVFDSAAAAASRRSVKFCGGGIEVGTILYAFSGEILGFDNAAVEIGGRLGWKAE